MAKKVSNTTPLFGNRRSHACNATRHAQKPNYQKVKLFLDKQMETILNCVCLVRKRVRLKKTIWAK